MRKKDILPSLGRGFIAGTLLIQSITAYQNGKMGSLIGLSLSFIVFLAMNWKLMCACSQQNNCDIATKKAITS